MSPTDVNRDLVELLRGFRTDHSLVLPMYERLFRARLWAMVADPTADLAAMMFLSYPSKDGIREVPVFTSPNRRLVPSFTSANPAPTPLELEGEHLWSRLLEILESPPQQVAVDPGEPHGIRITVEMIAMMVNRFSTPSNGA